MEFLDETVKIRLKKYVHTRIFFLSLKIFIETKPQKSFYKNVASQNRKGCGHNWEEILCLNKMQLIKNTSQFQFFFNLLCRLKMKHLASITVQLTNWLSSVQCKEGKISVGIFNFFRSSNIVVYYLLWNKPFVKTVEKKA